MSRKKNPKARAPTWFGRKFRNAVERIFDRYREGPDPPERLLEEVRLFRVLADHTPTEEEWEDFATRLAERAWRDAFERGYYWAERLWEPDEDPEAILEREARLSLRADPAWARALEKPLTARQYAEWSDKISQAAAAGIDVHVEDARDWKGPVRQIR